MRTVGQILVWAVLCYAAWRALKAGWDAWLESFTGTSAGSRSAAGWPPNLITPQAGGQSSPTGGPTTHDSTPPTRRGTL